MIPLPMRWLAFRAALRQLVTGQHTYLSTGCLFGGIGHDHCSSPEGASALKRPGRSKFTDAPCICPHHRGNPDPL